MSENDGFFHGGHWGQCLELLSHLCHYSDNILLVTGPQGIGKTAMRLALSQVEGNNFALCSITASEDLSAEDLTETIEINYASPSKDLLLLIDDAELLAIDVIAALLQFKQRPELSTRLHMVLFASNEFEQRISRSVLREEFAELVHIIELEPLTLSEMESFLMFEGRKLNNAKLFPKALLSKAQCKKIYALSSGNPGKVKQLAKDLFSGKNIRGYGNSGLSPITVGITVSLGIMFCVLALLWPAADNYSGANQQAIVAEKERDEATEEIMQVGLAPELSESMPEASPEVAAIQEELAAPVDTVAETQPVQASLDDDKIARLEKKLDQLQQQLASEQEARRAAESKYDQLFNKPVAAAQPKKVEVKPKEVKKAPATKSEKTGKKQPADQPKSLWGNHESSASNKLHFTKQERHILALPKANYTLQLIGLRDEIEVINFIKQHRLTGLAYYYKSTFKGKPWYVVVYGSYPSKFAAQAALTKLPWELRKLRPWTRTFADVQAAIKKTSN